MRFTRKETTMVEPTTITAAQNAASEIIFCPRDEKNLDALSQFFESKRIVVIQQHFEKFITHNSYYHHGDGHKVSVLPTRPDIRVTIWSANSQRSPYRDKVIEKVSETIGNFDHDLLIHMDHAEVPSDLITPQIVHVSDFDAAIDIIQNYREQVLSELTPTLSNLAYQFRSTGHPEKRETIQRAYNNILHRACNWGWDDVIDVESELPDRFMPQWYREKHPLY
jgi:hypothetical protein